MIASVRSRASSGGTIPVRSFDLRAFDGLRGLAALYIVAHHARIDLWEGSHRALASGGFAALLAFATVPLRYGAEVVLLFFLLSGFVIHLRQAQSLARGERPRLDAIGFFRRRAKRLVPPLLFALVLTAGLDAVGSRADASVYGAYADARSGFVFAMNALFLQGFAAPTFGSNSALWSLAYEAIFYAIYPLWLLARVRFGARSAFGGAFALGLAGMSIHVAMPAIGWTVAPYFAVWLLGALVAEAFARDASLRAPAAMLAAGFALMAPSLVAPGTLDPAVQSAIFGSGLALLMALFVMHPAARGAASGLARLSGLGARSYTLYVVHTPLLVCIAALWLRMRGSLPESGWLMPVGIAAAVALAYAVAPIVELPFSRRAKASAATTSSAKALRTMSKRRIAVRRPAMRIIVEEVADERQAA